MRRGLVALGALFGAAVLALFAFLIYVLLASGDPKYWAGIAAFERRDVSTRRPKTRFSSSAGAISGSGRRLPGTWRPLRSSSAASAARRSRISITTARASSFLTTRAPSSSWRARPIFPTCTEDGRKGLLDDFTRAAALAPRGRRERTGLFRLAPSLARARGALVRRAARQCADRGLCFPRASGACISST